MRSKALSPESSTNYPIEIETRWDLIFCFNVKPISSNLFFLEFSVYTVDSSSWSWSFLFLEIIFKYFFVSCWDILKTVNVRETPHIQGILMCEKNHICIYECCNYECSNYELQIYNYCNYEYCNLRKEIEQLIYIIVLLI